MSYVIAAPNEMAAAAGNWRSIGSTLAEATAAAAAPTTLVAPAGADEISVALSGLLSNHGLNFSRIAAKLHAYQQEIANLLNSSATAYADAEAGAKNLLGTASDALTNAGTSTKNLIDIGSGEVEEAIEDLFDPVDDLPPYESIEDAIAALFGR